MLDWIVFGCGATCLIVGLVLFRSLRCVLDMQKPSGMLMSYINSGAKEISARNSKRALLALLVIMVVILGSQIAMGEFHNLFVPIVMVMGTVSAILTAYFMSEISTRGLVAVYEALKESESFFMRQMGKLAASVGLVSLGILIMVSSLTLKLVSFFTGSVEETLLRDLSPVLQAAHWSHFTNYVTHFHHFQIIEMTVVLLALCLGTTIYTLSVRLSGSIYAKIVDVFSDSVGRTDYDLMEDDLRNPGSIPDLVGDQVSNVIGMGMVIYECILFCIAAASVLRMMSLTSLAGLSQPQVLAMFLEPLLLFVVGAMISALILMVKLWWNLRSWGIRTMMLMSYVLLSLGAFLGEYLGLLMPSFAGFVVTGAVVGMALTLNNRWATSVTGNSVRRVIASFESSAVSGFLNGGLQAAGAIVVPILSAVMALVVPFWLTAGQGLTIGFHGVSLVLVALLSPAGLVMSLGALGAVSDNVRGISEMVMDSDEALRRAREQDANGTEPSTLLKTFAIVSGMSSCLFLVVFLGRRLMYHLMIKGGVEYRIVEDFFDGLNLTLMNPHVITGLIWGSLLIVIFTGLLIVAVRSGGVVLTEQIRTQMATKSGIWNGETLPDYHEVIERIHGYSHRWTRRILGTMVVMSITTLFLFGVEGSMATLMGAIIVGLFVSLFSNYVGGIWRNAKKVMEISADHASDSNAYSACVFVDGIGDILKDTVAPTLYILVKMMGIIIVLFGVLALS